MADKWGGSWGSSWALSWSGGDPTPPVVPPAGLKPAGRSSRGKKKRIQVEIDGQVYDARDVGEVLEIVEALSKPEEAPPVVKVIAAPKKKIAVVQAHIDRVLRPSVLPIVDEYDEDDDITILLLS